MRALLELGDAEPTLLGPPLDGALAARARAARRRARAGRARALRVDAAERGGGGSGERLRALLHARAARQGLLKLVAASRRAPASPFTG